MTVHGQHAGHPCCCNNTAATPVRCSQETCLLWPDTTLSQRGSVCCKCAHAGTMHAVTAPAKHSPPTPAVPTRTLNSHARYHRLPGIIPAAMLAHSTTPTHCPAHLQATLSSSLLGLILYAYCAAQPDTRPMKSPRVRLTHSLPLRCGCTWEEITITRRGVTSMCHAVYATTDI